MNDCNVVILLQDTRSTVNVAFLLGWQDKNFFGGSERKARRRWKRKGEDLREERRPRRGKQLYGMQKELETFLARPRGEVMDTGDIVEAEYRTEGNA